MAEIALDCGYPASSLKERVYALSGPTAAPNAAAFSSIRQLPAQGTLGGWSERRQDLRKSSKAHWNGQGSARTIRSAPTINRTTAARSRHARSCVPWLLAHRRDELRNEKSVPHRSLLVPTIGPDGSAFFRI